ncbi:hypothetical protein VSVS05_00531 [Vibrio scophthalmi]|uniref:Uncharacterized protein n=1 Tax=Vibrio scophthalmi TaxID=45658 RepID=A0A1C7F8M4_9VIBR|nr:hypothetical protein VSVS05_00531 [Vibrio scophthalmi]
MASSPISSFKNRIGRLMPNGYLHSRKIHYLSRYYASHQSKHHSDQTHP